jgi:hypothetical protein
MTQHQVHASEIRHRRETWLWLVLPMALLILLIAAAVAIVVFVPRDLRESQTSIIADLMFSVLMLCPAMVCMLPVTILALGAVIGFSRVHGMMARPLRIVQDYSASMTSKTKSATDMVNQKTIDVSSRLGFIDKHLETFEQKPHQEDIDG